MGRLFGTDGARGVANTELTAELAMNIGRAAAMVLVNDEVKHPTILIGKDTRLSGDMLEGALIAGLCSVGANVKLLGVVPTPAVAYLVKKYNADAGVMISASHNRLNLTESKFSVQRDTNSRMTSKTESKKSYLTTQFRMRQQMTAKSAE